MKGDYLIAEIRNSLKKIEKNNKTFIIIGVALAMMAFIGIVVYIALKAKNKSDYDFYGDYDDYDDYDEFDYADYGDSEDDQESAYETLSFEEE